MSDTKSQPSGQDKTAILAKILSGMFAPGDGHRATARLVVEGLAAAGFVIVPREIVEQARRYVENVADCYVPGTGGHAGLLERIDAAIGGAP